MSAARYTERLEARTAPKVLVLTVDNARSDVGSAHNRIWNVLGRRGYRVLLVMRGTTRQRSAKRDDVSLEVVPVPEVPGLQWILLNLVVLATCARKRFDLIFFTPRTWIAARILKLLGTSQRSILDIRTVPVHRNLLHRLFEKVELHLATILSSADAITIINPETRDYLIGPFAKRVPIAFWGSGVDFELFNPAKSKSEKSDLPDSFLSGKVAIYHGSLTDDRGIPQLIEAVTLVRAQGIDARLLLLGDGPIVDRIRFRFQKLLDANILILRGPVGYEHVPTFLRFAQIGVIPFPQSRKWETQMPLKLLEYLAMGKVVVATDMPSHRGYGQGVILVDNNAPSTIAAGLTRAMTMPDDQQRRRVEDSIRKIANLSWEDQATKLHRVIAGLLKS